MTYVRKNNKFDLNKEICEKYNIKDLSFDETILHKFDSVKEAVKYAKVNKLRVIHFSLWRRVTDKELDELNIKHEKSMDNDFDNCFDCGILWEKEQGTYVKRKRKQIFLCKYCPLEMKDKVVKRGNFKW